jgi:hypothetical protein
MGKRLGALALGIFGLYLCASGLYAIIEGFSSRSVEFMNNWAVLVIIDGVVVLAGVGTVGIARKLWLGG